VTERGWYVVHAHPRRESFVRDRIAELGRETFLPLLREKRPGRRRATLGPLFPGYLFAKLSEAEGDLPRVRWTHGVRRILGDGERPRSVPDAVVDAMRARADRDGKVRLGARPRRGQRVRILDGPLAGLLGVLERATVGADQRVLVLLSLFSRPTLVSVDADAVVGVSGPGSS